MPTLIFSKAGIQYHRTATVNQFDFEKQRKLRKRAWSSTSFRQETSKDYELYVPFFWRGDDE